MSITWVFFPIFENFLRREDQILIIFKFQNTKTVAVCFSFEGCLSFFIHSIFFSEISRFFTQICTISPLRHLNWVIAFEYVLAQKSRTFVPHVLAICIFDCIFLRWHIQGLQNFDLPQFEKCGKMWHLKKPPKYKETRKVWKSEDNRFFFTSRQVWIAPYFFCQLAFLMFVVPMPVLNLWYCATFSARNGVFLGIARAAGGHGHDPLRRPAGTGRGDRRPLQSSLHCLRLGSEFGSGHLNTAFHQSKRHPPPCEEGEEVQANRSLGASQQPFYSLSRGPIHP